MSNFQVQIGACLISKTNQEDQPFIVDCTMVPDNSGQPVTLWNWVDENSGTWGTLTDDEINADYDIVDVFDSNMPEIEESKQVYYKLMQDDSLIQE